MSGPLYPTLDSKPLTSVQYRSSQAPAANGHSGGSSLMDADGQLRHLQPSPSLELQLGPQELQVYKCLLSHARDLSIVALLCAPLPDALCLKDRDPCNGSLLLSPSCTFALREDISARYLHLLGWSTLLDVRNDWGIFAKAWLAFKTQSTFGLGARRLQEMVADRCPVLQDPNVWCWMPDPRWEIKRAFWGSRPQERAARAPK